MASYKLVPAIALLLATPSLAWQADPVSEGAPAGTAATRYCMKISLTGSRIEKVKCWTRAEWAAEGVDVDLDWPREGVRVID